MEKKKELRIRVAAEYLYNALEEITYQAVENLQTSPTRDRGRRMLANAIVQLVEAIET